MATQTISTVGDIPELLDPFYLGRPGEHCRSTWVQKTRAGLLDRGFEAIFPDELTGAAAYAKGSSL
jgi:hypothetical protein